MVTPDCAIGRSVKRHPAAAWGGSPDGRDVHARSAPRRCLDIMFYFRSYLACDN